MKKFNLNQVFRKSRICLLCTLFILSISSCSILNKLLDIGSAIVNTLNNVNVVLDNTTNNLNSNAANFTQIMEEAIQSIKDQNIKAQLQAALDNAIVTASTEIRCDVQFTADYLIRRIQAIKAQYNHQPVPISEPKVCTVLPSIIDMNLSPNQRNLVQVTGYFLKDDFSKYKLFHHTSTGVITNRTSCLSANTDFKLQINLGSSGIVMDKNSSKLVLMWDDDIVSVIPVVQRQPVPCELRERELVNLPKMMVYPEQKKDPRLNKDKGDKEFDGHGPCSIGSVSIFTRNNNTELWARVFVRMWECPDNLNKSHSDYSYGDKTVEMKLVTTDFGWRIKKIKQTTSESFQNIDRVCNDTENFAGSGVVAQYLILGDTSGNDLGSSYVQVTFRPVKVTLEKIGDCISN
jgi:hypothetical protein